MASVGVQLSVDEVLARELESYRGDLRGLLFSRFGPRCEAEFEEVFHRSVIATFQAIKRGARVRDRRAYLAQAAMRMYRRAHQQPSAMPFDPHHTTFSSLADLDEAVESKALKRLTEADQLGLLEEMLEQLPELQAQALTLRYCEELNRSEIGERLGYPTRGVEKLLIKGLKQLHEFAAQAQDGSWCDQFQSMIHALGAGWPMNPVRRRRLKRHLGRCGTCQTLSVEVLGSARALGGLLPGPLASAGAIHLHVNLIEAAIAKAKTAVAHLFTRVGDLAQSAPMAPKGIAPQALGQLVTTICGVGATALTCVAAGVSPIGVASGLVNDHLHRVPAAKSAATPGGSALLSPPVAAPRADPSTGKAEASAKAGDAKSSGATVKTSADSSPDGAAGAEPAAAGSPASGFSGPDQGGVLITDGAQAGSRNSSSQAPLAPTTTTTSNEPPPGSGEFGQSAP